MKILGPELFARGDAGQLQSRVGTVFPQRQLLVTAPGIHATQRAAALAGFNQDRAAQGLAPLSGEQEMLECAHSVDLFFEPDVVLIRPDPAHMDLAFAADELLQERISKRRIKFMFVFNERVHDAIRERGEYWRISSPPQSHEGMRQLIRNARVAIGEQPIYYYSRASGTRFLTGAEFARLEQLPPDALARQLEEIAQHARRRNRFDNPEVDFFQADPARFGLGDWAGPSFTTLTAAEVQTRFRELRTRFAAAVPPAFQADDPLVEQWRNAMFTALVRQKDEPITDEVLRGLSPDFFLQIEWLPGGRFEEGEFIPDAVLTEAQRTLDDPELQRLYDAKALGFTYNFVREYGDLEYINVGRIPGSLSHRQTKRGQRGVYLVEFKAGPEPAPIVRFLRMQKWDVAEHLDEGKSLLEAIVESDEYTDYILDRRMGCRQLGMNLVPRVTMRHIAQVYQGSNQRYVGHHIRETYFERDYLYGTATDKLPPWKFQNEDFALRVAALVGKAAASNLIIGRTYDRGDQVIFDDGDEVLIEDGGRPKELIVADHSGAFDEYRRPLLEFAREYARPVNSRLALVPRPREFAAAYLTAFRDWFRHVQGDYRKRRRAFDTLFKHCKYDPAGSYGYRWECVLRRLDTTDVSALVNAIQRHITVPAAGPVAEGSGD